MDVAAYYFPNYHRDERNEARHGKGWTEWELMKCARPRFANHEQPKIPLEGYEDEADSAVMAKKIAMAQKYGVDAFVFDWYWYDGPYLERALDEGFLAEAEKADFKFALMWANHDWYDRHPVSRNVLEAPLLYQWASTPENIGQVWDYVIEHYMTRPNYWRVEGLPYFSIYATDRFIRQMGGVDGAAAVLADFRARAKKAGLPGLHLNAIWFDNLESTDAVICPPSMWVKKVGFSSYTSYNSIFTTPVWKEHFPYVDCRQANEEYLQLATKAVNTLPAPYYPVITAGWDASPRTVQSEVYEYLDYYPYFPVMNPDPEAFGKLYRDLAALKTDVIFINAWNEWTEGSYMEPDTKRGYALLEALRASRNMK